MKKSSSRKSGSKRKNKNRSREKSLENYRKEKMTEKFDKPIIKIPVLDDSKSEDPKTIKDYIIDIKKDLNTGKINLETYIRKNDVDNEKIFLFLEDLLSKDINAFYKMYKKEFFKLTINQRILLQNKFQGTNNVDIPEFIKNNIVTTDNNILIKSRKIFINILRDLIKIKEVNINDIEKVFLNNNIIFEEEMDIKIPNKFGSKELRFYSLLNDLFYYFHFSGIRLDELFDIFSILSVFINKIKEDDEYIIKKSNYLFNILYMYLENKKIDTNMFFDIVSTCLPFDSETANNTIKSLKNLRIIIKFTINGIPLEKYEDSITGNETIVLEYPSKKIKIETLSKNINWDIGHKFFEYFISENFMLCLRYPENCKFNYFSMGEIGTLVDKFFNIMIHSKPMKQAMIIDKEASKYKYFFNNENILKEFNENVSLVPLPFQNYFGFTNKKSFDIYINVSYKTDNDFVKILKKYNIFFTSKSH